MNLWIKHTYMYFVKVKLEENRKILMEYLQLVINNEIEKIINKIKRKV